MKVTKTNLPEPSLLTNIPFDYLDSYYASVEIKDIKIETVGKLFFLSGPRWITSLLLLRDRLAGLIGLKTATDARDQKRVIEKFNCEVGDQIALFRVYEKNTNEVILGENDKHLDFRVSLFLDRSNDTLTVSTHVKFNNWIGRLYFIPVMPMHKIIVPVILRGMVKNLQEEYSQQNFIV